MDITVEPEIYCPIINDDGNYIDMCPAFINYGIRCPCGSRNDHVYDSRPKFKQHINSVKHKRWIDILTAEKNNHYKESIELKTIVKQQKEIICRMEIETTRLTNINKFLQDKLFNVEKPNIIMGDLLEIDN